MQTNLVGAYIRHCNSVISDRIKFCQKCQCNTERNADGKCKICKAAYRAANRETEKAKKAVYYSANKEKIRESSADYYVANLEKGRVRHAAWAKGNLEKIKATDAAYYTANKEKIKSDSAAYYLDNLEKVKARQAIWKKQNPDSRRIHSTNRRAIKRASGGKLCNGLSEKLFKLQRGKCACCNQPLGNDFHLDHIMPLVLGGKNTDDNIQLLRATCNLQKHAKHPIDFMQSRGFLL